MNEERRQRFYITVLCIGIIAALCIFGLVLGYGKIKVATVEKQNAELASQELKILVAVDPIAYLVERVGGDSVDVSVLTPPGKDPESFAPAPRQLAEYASTRLFFCVGLPIEERFEENIASIAPEAKKVDLAEKIELIFEDAEGSELDPHLWTSPANVRTMVKMITDSLCEAFPEKEDLFRANSAAFDLELQALQEEIKTKLASCEGRAFIVFHPAYGYFAREFGLKQLAIESEGKTPRPRDLANLIEEAKASGVRGLIAQPEFNRSSVEAVATAIDGRAIVHSPLEKDCFVNLRALTDAILATFSTPE